MSETDTNTTALIELDKQCHQHLRESNRKKDNYVGFYLTATFLLVGFFGKSLELKIIPPIVWICYALIVFVGFVLGWILTMYRGWHGCYIISSIVIQRLIQKGIKEVPFKFIKEINFKFSSIISIEFLNFSFLHVLILFNACIFCYLHDNINYKDFISTSLSTKITIILAALVIIEFIAHLVIMRYLDKWKSNGNLNEKYLWLLNGKIANDDKNPGTDHPVDVQEGRLKIDEPSMS